MKLKTLLIGLSALLILTLIPLMAVQPGGGSTGGNLPCYSPGEVISVGSWYSGPCYMTAIQTYIGSCMIRQDFYCNGQLQSSTTYSGGCSCGGISVISVIDDDICDE